MTLLSAIYKLLIGPLVLLFETIYAFALRYVHDPGIAIIFLSLAMNLLVLPLYRRADKMQAEERDLEDRLRPWVTHIKKTFRGDERFMMLQTYYRQNNYRPVQALKGSLPLLLEIPFFISAYHFLSGLRLLAGEPFGPINDLALPDGLLSIAGVTINLLPILMTIINAVSTAIYMQGMPLKNKLQMYGMALIFLVLLYNSPSGLVFYWTLNNLFSLLKNIFYKLHPSRKVLRSAIIVLCISVLIFLAAVIISHPFYPLRSKIVLYGIAGSLLLLCIFLIRGKPLSRNTVPADDRLFLISCCFAVIITGILIPSSVISSAPGDFVNIRNYYSPLWYVLSSLLLALGTFAVWFGIFYRIADSSVKILMEAGMGIFSVISVVDYFLFGTQRSDMSSLLVYMTPPKDSPRDLLINLAAVIFAAVVYCLLRRKNKKFLTAAMATVCLALGVMSVRNVSLIVKDLSEIREFSKVQTGKDPVINLSKNGRNVIIFMMDRSLGYFVPYIMAERTELQQKFDGFTFYPDTLSFGPRTITALPALYGGYEYTSDKINSRSDTSLREKHNEALRMMPVIFQENGFDVTVIDPSFANYRNPPDLSIYDDYPEIKAYTAEGLYSLPELLQADINTRSRNIFCFSLYKTVPLIFQPMLYSNGLYNDPDAVTGRNAIETGFQKVNGLLTADGLNAKFYDTYSVLVNLPSITQVRDSDKDTYLSIDNNTAHEPTLLQMPDYKLEARVNNENYEITPIIRRSLDGSIINLTTTDQLTHYHANMAAFMILGEWMDFLREKGIYDNTRIIIAADHGQNMGFPETMFGENWYENVTAFNPVLMYKDFDSRGFSIDEQFMTNADVPILAMAGLIDHPHNPFTGNPVSSEEKNALYHDVQYNNEFRVEDNNGNVFFPGSWYRLYGGNIFSLADWESLGYY